MGWAAIASGGPEGLYSVDLDLGAQRVQETINDLTAFINQLQTVLIPQDQAVLTAAEAEVTLWKEVLNIRIGQMNAAIAAGDKAEEESIRKSITAVTIPALAERINKEFQARTALTRSKFQLAALQKELAQKQKIITYKEKQAWCADLTEDATGIVATLEIPGEPTHLLVAPGGRAPDANDGKLLARGAMSGPQAYWNAAVLPGWQKWKPDYRAGIISDINYETNRARVTLLDVRSSATRAVVSGLTITREGFPVNRLDVLNAVPIEYMTCNADAFKDGDVVVVKFEGRSWSAPKVIGFLDHPKACDLDGIACIPASDSAPNGWGEGSTSDPQYVSPLGVPGAAKPYVVIHGTPPDALTVRRFKQPEIGLANNIGRVVYTLPDGKTTLVAFLSGDRSAIYRDGKKLGETPAGAYLSDMAFYTEGGTKYLWCMCFDQLRGNVMSYRALYTTASLSGWQLLGQKNAEAEFGTNEPWLGAPRAFHRASINASATQCVVFVFHGVGGYEGFWATSTKQFPSGDPLPAPTGGYVIFTSRDLSTRSETWNAPIAQDLRDFSCSVSSPNVSVNATYQYTRVFDAYFAGDVLKTCTYSVSGSWLYQITRTAAEQSGLAHVEFTENTDHTITLDFGFSSPITVSHSNHHHNIDDNQQTYSAEIDRDMSSITVWYYDWTDKAVLYTIRNDYANGTVSGEGLIGDNDTFSGTWANRSDLYLKTSVNNVTMTTTPILSSGTFTNSGGDAGTSSYTSPSEPPPNGWRGGQYSTRRGIRWSAFRHSGPRYIGGDVVNTNVVPDPLATIVRELTPGNVLNYPNVRDIANLSSWKDRVFLSVRKRTHGNLFATETSPEGPSLLVNQYINVFDGVNVETLTQVVGANPRFKSICRW